MSERDDGLTRGGATRRRRAPSRSDLPGGPVVPPDTRSERTRLGARAWAPASVLPLSALLAVVAVAQVEPATIDTADIRPGMRGYGLSVFQGTEPQRFDVEVIDVLDNFRPDQDLILIRTPHPLLDHTRAVAGMSGSPIYLDGKLAGAYAYGWPSGLDPVAGVTPIANMLAELRRPVRPDAFPGALRITPRGAPRADAGSRPRPPDADSLAGLPPFVQSSAPVGPFDALRAHARRHAEVTGDRIGPERASTPLMLGGVDDAVARLLGEALSPYGLVPVQAGGGGGRRAATPTPRFVDGGSIAVQLARGDITMSAIGTVTHVSPSGRVVAFGHPMMNAGQSGLPTAAARVLHVFASSTRSFKIGEAGAPLGALVHDRQSAIVVDPSLRAATIPMRVRVHGAEGAPRTEWNVELASQRVLSPLLAFAVLGNALQATVADQTEVSFRARMRVGVEGQGTLELVDEGYMNAGPLEASTLTQLRLFAVLAAAYGNPFERSRVTGIEVDLELTYGPDLSTIVGVQIPGEPVDPGSTAELRVRLRRHGAEEVVRVVPVPIPADAAGETLEVVLSPGSAVTLEQPQPTSLADLLRAVSARLPATSIVASVKRASRGLSFPGHVVRSLPGSALDALQLVNDTGAGAAFVTEERHEVPFGGVVAGSATVRLEVRRLARGR